MTGTRDILFTQYLRPLGKPVPVTIDRPHPIADLAEAIIARGYRFECEHLTTGEASFTITDEDGDHAIAVCKNGPEVETVIDDMIEKFAKAKGLT